MVLNDSYGFTSGQLAAPQANAMAAVIDPLMNGVGAPWALYGAGAVLAIVLTYFKVPALAFALGRGEKGTLLASGFIAGGALMGVVSAVMRYCDINLVNESWLANPMSQVVALVAYALLIIYLVKASMSIKK